MVWNEIYRKILKKSLLLWQEHSLQRIQKSIDNTYEYSFQVISIEQKKQLKVGESLARIICENYSYFSYSAKIRKRTIYTIVQILLDTKNK